MKGRIRAVGFLFVAWAAVGFALPLWAGTVEEELQGLKDRVNALESRGPAAAEGGKPAGGPERKEESSGYGFDVGMVKEEAGRLGVEIHGRADVSWGSHQFDLAQGGSKDRNFFDANIAFWVGAEINDYVSAVAEIEYEHSAEETEIDLMNIQVVPFPDRKGNVVTLGKFYVPFGVEYLSYPAHKNYLISRPYPMRTIVPGTWSSTGVKVDVETGGEALPARIGGSVYVIHGMGQSSATKADADNFRDNNDDKSIGAQVRLMTNVAEAGLSGVFGKWDPGDNLGYWMAGLYGVLRLGGAELTAEYVAADFEVSGSPDGKPRGYYLQAFLPVREALGVVGRYDYVKSRGGLSLFRGPAADSEADRVAFGVRWTPWKATVVKGEYIYRDDTTPGVKDRNAVATQVAVHW